MTHEPLSRRSAKTRVPAAVALTIAAVLSSACGLGRRAEPVAEPTTTAAPSLAAAAASTASTPGAADEVEIQATPKPGTAVADRDGLVVVLDTGLTPALLAEGDARELTRAIQDLRRDAGLELDDRIMVWLDGLPGAVRPHLDEVLADTLAVAGEGSAPGDATRGEVGLDGGTVHIALGRVDR